MKGVESNMKKKKTKEVKTESVVIGQVYVRNNKAIFVISDYIENAISNYLPTIRTKKTLLNAIISGKFVCHPYSSKVNVGDSLELCELEECDRTYIKMTIQQEIEKHKTEIERLECVL